MPLYLAARFVVLLLESLCALLFFDGFFKARAGGSILLRSALLSLVLFAFSVGIELFLGAEYLLMTALNILVLLSALVVLLGLLYDGPLLNKLILACIWVFVLYMVNSLVTLLWGASPVVEGSLAERVYGLNDFLLSLLQKASLLLVVLLVRLFARKGNRTASLNNPRWLPFLLLPLLSILSISAMFNNNWGEGGGGRSLTLVLCIGWLLVNAVAFLFLQRMEEREQRWQQTREMRRIASAEVKSLEAVAQAKRRQRQLTHDFENHLLCLKNYMDAGEYERARDYIYSISGSLQEEAEHAGTGHNVVDSILNQKISRAAARGISLATTISDLHELPMADDDMVAILGNLLDNAIEACEKLPAGSSPVIDVKLVQEDGSLILSVKNPVARPVRIVDGDIPTSKSDGEGHGIGLQSVKAALGKYDASYAIRCDDGHFVFSAMVDFEDEAAEGIA